VVPVLRLRRSTGTTWFCWIKGFFIALQKFGMSHALLSTQALSMFEEKD